jgi:hypothetical protein
MPQQEASFARSPSAFEEQSLSPLGNTAVGLGFLSGSRWGDPMLDRPAKPKRREKNGGGAR